jgi:hypothetical protein
MVLWFWVPHEFWAPLHSPRLSRMWPLRKAFESTALEAVKKNIVDKVGEAGAHFRVVALWCSEKVQLKVVSNG